ncbi:DUF309 domain-containing protein [Salinicoccus roseus]|uniref:DUF309 domain-containing protein n=1 Tax=Salinicoccus roseus TaxID=45670 RepID=UPI001CA64DD9|nr:DUF309 domain-containing protein [Salinicoccus roseus]MBY8908409.1 DUF309 domain-containing protein [Salinicoccus roseus]
MKLFHLIDFYNELIIKQDYFECHEIMEATWKSSPAFSKNDAEVFLILLATGEYHYRRGNINGAVRAYRRALKLHEENTYDLTALGMGEELVEMMIARMENMEDMPFHPLAYPLTEDMWQALHEHGGYGPSPDIEAFKRWTRDRVVQDEEIVYKHRLRDRTEVLLEREAAIKKRKHRK